MIMNASTISPVFWLTVDAPAEKSWSMAVENNIVCDPTGKAGRINH